MKFDFLSSLTFHSLILGVVGGLTWGAHNTPDLSNMVISALTGLTIALAVTLFIRLLLEIGDYQ